MSMVVSRQEEKNKKSGMIISIVVHITLLLMALLPLLTYPDPPPGQEGILVNLGLPDQGQGDENMQEGEQAPAEETPVEEVEPQPEEVTPPKEEVKKPEPVKEKEIIRTEDPDEVAIKRKKEQERKEREEADRKTREEEARKKAAEDERKRQQAAEEARKKAEADKLKGDIGSAFGGGKGKGKGNTGTSGNQGDPGGDPNSSNLEGVSTGSGNVGGGLQSRGRLKSPKVSENSQKQGTVVVEVCVNADGDVTTARFKQGGSTTTDAQLVNAAVENAKSWKFTPGPDQQCGTITYRFKLQ